MIISAASSGLTSIISKKWFLQMFYISKANIPGIERYYRYSSWQRNGYDTIRTTNINVLSTLTAHHLQPHHSLLSAETILRKLTNNLFVTQRNPTRYRCDTLLPSFSSYRNNRRSILTDRLMSHYLDSVAWNLPVILE